MIGNRDIISEPRRETISEMLLEPSVAFVCMKVSANISQLIGCEAFRLRHYLPRFRAFRDNIRKPTARYTPSSVSPAIFRSPRNTVFAQFQSFVFRHIPHRHVMQFDPVNIAKLNRNSVSTTRRSTNTGRKQDAGLSALCENFDTSG